MEGSKNGPRGSARGSCANWGWDPRFDDELELERGVLESNYKASKDGERKKEIWADQDEL
tara:strand:+ start:249 stop:428 length:180 start_codon:yes stop_codon:yes gene_type:complete